MSSIPPSENMLSRSLVAAWQADEPSPAELRRGYARLERKPRKAGAPRMALWLLGGLVLGMGLAQAATSSRWSWRGAQEPTLTPVAPKPAPAAPAMAAAPPRSATPPLETPALAATARSPATATHTAAAIGATPVDPTPVGPTPHVQEQWQRAATALRVDDFGAAQAAFLEIERSTGGAERDAARLARAQLLSSHGRTAEALPLLRDLAAQAQSSPVRDKAHDLLARLTKTDARDRSTARPGVTKRP